MNEVEAESAEIELLGERGFVPATLASFLGYCACFLLRHLRLVDHSRLLSCESHHWVECYSLVANKEPVAEKRSPRPPILLVSAVRLAVSAAPAKPTSPKTRTRPPITAPSGSVGSQAVIRAATAAWSADLPTSPLVVINPTYQT